MEPNPEEEQGKSEIFTNQAHKSARSLDHEQEHPRPSAEASRGRNGNYIKDLFATEADALFSGPPPRDGILNPSLQRTSMTDGTSQHMSPNPCDAYSSTTSQPNCVKKPATAVNDGDGGENAQDVDLR